MNVVSTLSESHVMYKTLKSQNGLASTVYLPTPPTKKSTGIIACIIMICHGLCPNSGRDKSEGEGDQVGDDGITLKSSEG